jgi:hypothetical protein
MGNPYPIVVVVKIAGSIQPLDRGARYEDPLASVLARHAAGRVNGAGTQLDQHLQIAFAEIELELRDLEAALELVRGTLLGVGVPAGSFLYFSRDGRPREMPLVAERTESDSTSATQALLRRLDRSVTRDQAAAASSAVKILTSFKKLWVVRSESLPVDITQYDPTLVYWHQSVTAELATLGFSSLGDFANAGDEPVHTKPRRSPFARKYLSADGRVRATAFKLELSARARENWGVVGFTSELNTGLFLTTSNRHEVWNIPPQMIAERLAPQTSPVEIATRHLARLQVWLQENPQSTLSLFSSLEDLLASELRGKSLTAAFRAHQGVPSAAELERMGAKPLFAAMVHEEMKRIGAAKGPGESSSANDNGGR